MLLCLASAALAVLPEPFLALHDAPFHRSSSPLQTKKPHFLFFMISQISLSILWRTFFKDLFLLFCFV